MGKSKGKGRVKGKERDKYKGRNKDKGKEGMDKRSYMPYLIKIRSFMAANAPFTTSVFLRIWPRRNTTVILSHVIRKNTVVYGAYIPCIRPYTGSYMVVNGRIRSSYTSTWAVTFRYFILLTIV
jgi:hypothetical protein